MTFSGQESNCQFDSWPFFLAITLCLKCPNGSCDPILYICILRFFQWYNDLFNPMGFVPCIHSLKYRASIETPTPKMGAHLEVWRFIPSDSPTLLGAWDVTPGLPSCLAPLQPLALVMSPRLRLRHLPYHLHDFKNLTLQGKPVATLALCLWPRQRGCKSAGQKEARESHHILVGIQECVREWTLTLTRQLPLWEMESMWTFKTLESDFRGQNSMDCGVLYIIRKLLKLRCLKWVHIIHPNI